jgi:uncharacterized protein (TIGR02118 family)
MTHLLVLYSAPSDTVAFDRYYCETHIPIANRIPGLRSYAISSGPVTALAGTAPYLVAELTFDSMADLNAALASPEGKAAADDLPNFANGGVTPLTYNTEKVG